VNSLKSLLILLLATEVAVAAPPPPPAAPAASKGRSIAVLEFRGGASGAGGIGARVAAILRKRTSHAITDPDDARRENAKVDDLVARCTGQPPCIAEIGRKLKVDEVLLVGVSELGDLILAFQRVDSKSGSVLGRVADSLPRDTRLDDQALEAYLRRLLPREDFLRWGTLRIDADIAGAEVRLGGEAKGRTPLEPIPVLAPATVDLRVSKQGYSDFRARIDVMPDATVEVRPIMNRKPGTAWYERPWVWAIAGAIVVGGVTTAVVLAQPAAKSVPVDVKF
jgi:PEGA domain-containing protein